MYDVANVVDNTGFLRRTWAPTLDPYGDNWQQQAYNLRARTGHLRPRSALSRGEGADPQSLKRLVKATGLR